MSDSENGPRPMNPKVRAVLSVLTGAGLGGVAVAMIEVLNAQVFPLPAGVDPSDRVALGEAVVAGGPLPLLGVAFAWFMGAFLGSWLAVRIGTGGAADGSTGRGFAGIVTGFFAAGALATLLSFPHPVWFWVVGLAAVAAGGHLGWEASKPAVNPARPRKNVT